MINVHSVAGTLALDGVVSAPAAVVKDQAKSSASEVPSSSLAPASLPFTIAVCLEPGAKFPVGLSVTFRQSTLTVSVAVTGVGVPSSTSVKVSGLNVSGFIASENAAETSLPRDTPFASRLGVTLVTVGAITCRGGGGNGSSGGATHAAGTSGANGIILVVDGAKGPARASIRSW
jgi:hypothetical protein